MEYDLFAYMISIDKDISMNNSISFPNTEHTEIFFILKCF